MKPTTDPGKIKAWAKKYRAQPAIIDDPQAGEDKVGIRFDFPGKKDEIFLSSQKTFETTWKKFFKIFENQNLAVVLKDPSPTVPKSESYYFVKKDQLID